MTLEFKPLKTTQDSFEAVESTIHSQVMAMGFDEDIAGAAAHSFTRFSLGYETAEGVYDRLTNQGASDDFARHMIEMFRRVTAQVPEMRDRVSRM